LELERINISNNQLTFLNVNHCLNLNFLDISINQLTSLNISNCVNLTELNVHKNQLTSLELNNCLNLKALQCFGNQLTSLTLPKSNQASLVNNNELSSNEVNHDSSRNELSVIEVSNNYLTTFNYDCLNPLTLKELVIANNNLAATDLEVFTHFVNLTSLYIGNEDAYLKNFRNNSENA